MMQQIQKQKKEKSTKKMNKELLYFVMCPNSFVLGKLKKIKVPT